MKSIAIKDLSENFFEVIGKEWMLVTAGSKEHFNTMTASWGGIGWLWNKPVVFVFIRSERYTYEFMEENEYFTLSFLGKENRSIYNLCGSKSGREVDKVKETGLNPIVTERGNILPSQFCIVTPHWPIISPFSLSRTAWDWSAASFSLPI